MSTLVRVALEVLEDPGAPPGLRSVACSTLLHALEQAVDVPHGTHMTVWRYLLASDCGASSLHRHEIPNADVATDAVRVLLDVDAGENAQDLALAVLKGANVTAITNEHVVTIADRVLDEGRVRRIGWLIERVHEERGLPPEFIKALRDRLAGSTLAVVRAAAIEVGGLLPRMDESFALRMLGDEAPVVRQAVADLLEKAGMLDRERAAAIIRGQLAVEHHRSVVSACYFALASLVRSGGRRVRQWEPPTGDVN